jgi:hypothetical protein
MQFFPPPHRFTSIEKVVKKKSVVKLRGFTAQSMSVDHGSIHAGQGMIQLGDRTIEATYRLKATSHACLIPPGSI